MVYDSGGVVAYGVAKRAKVTTIKESKDLSSLALDELIDNLKVQEVVIEKDFEIYRGKKERVKSIALKAKKDPSDDETLTSKSNDETLTSRSDDEEYTMAVRNFKKLFSRKGKFVRQPKEEKKSFRQRDEMKGKSDQKCFRCGNLNHLIGDCPKPPRNRDQKAFLKGSWSDSKNDASDKTNDEACLMAQSSNEETLNYSYYSDNASSLVNDKKEILELNEKIKKLERNKEIDITCESCQELNLEKARLKESKVKFVKFDKSTNSLREMLNNQKSSGFQIGLGLDSSKASKSGTKPINFVGSSAKIAPSGSTIKAHGSTIPGSVDPSNSEKAAEDIFSLLLSSRSDFVITGKKLIHNKIEESKKPSLKPSLKSVLNKHTMKVEESLNVTFDEISPPTKLSPLVDDDVGEEEAIENNTRVVNNSNEEDESIEANKVYGKRDEKKRLDHLKQDLRMLVIKRFRERKKSFRERMLFENIMLRGVEGDDKELVVIGEVGGGLFGGGDGGEGGRL
nr:hypothetical protein [Tanacetum cinerariifolium]